MARPRLHPVLVIVVPTGVAAGLFGDLPMLVLFTVQHLAFGYHTGTLESGCGTPPIPDVSSCC